MRKLVNVVIPPLAQPFTYSIPPGLSVNINVGCCVEVPFGRRTARGYVIEDKNKSRNEDSEAKFEIKAIHDSVNNLPCFNPAQLKFFKWISDYYSVPLASVIDAAIPPPVRPKFESWITLNPDAEVTVNGKLQKEIIALLKERAAPVSVSELSARFKGASQSIKRLAARGIINLYQHEIASKLFAKQKIPEWTKSNVTLNNEQEQALRNIKKAIEAQVYKPFTLYGVTGSGKTEVYIEAIKLTLEAGRGAIVIVPEIALTPQLIDRFRARLGDQLAVLHSGLSKRQRWESWKALLEGRSMISIGARSGVFAPLKSCGLIIVDEEHDPSYKQSEGLRYNARDLALVRGKLENCPVILGSATPSLETYYNTSKKKYTLLKLPSRHASASEVSIELVDLNRLKPWQMPSPNVSPQLKDAIGENLERGEQVFILYNRRGFASYLQCERCESVLSCPNCSVTLTYHQSNNSLHCHYCGMQTLPPLYCQECQASDKPASLIQRGAGTEKIYEELKEMFPGVAIDRLDRDAVSDIKRYREILDGVRSHKTAILVGTQMIAKGHDLPGVTLVGIADCDVGLHMPDFRASERVFQLLTQAAGRAGRAEKPGRVILQTRVPKHISLIKTAEKDYQGFAKLELACRKGPNYPPFCRLLRIVASSHDAEAGREVLNIFRSQIEEQKKSGSLSCEVLGPARAPIERIRARWRWHLLLKSKNSSELIKASRMLQQNKLARGDLRIIFDLDPQEML
ncbi:MAG: primosomal protein N' [Candidatus Dadabacteria bacterium]|nr:MAG: primosomal protein N' [Candidatus Dadabacteria bacterium]